MTRYLCSFFLFCGWFHLPSTTAGPAPNIVFLFADDQRADTIGAWGNPHIQTPNLDRLVARGFSFRGNYCFGGNSGAVCIPSRAMLMSGRTWYKTPHSLEGVTTFPEHLRRHGYETFATGKWHNGQPSFLRSFDQGRSIHFGGMDDHTKISIQDLNSDRSFTAKRPAEHFSSEQFADRLIEFLRRPVKDKPFLAYVAFTAPHDPRNPPENWRPKKGELLPPLPANYLPQHPFNNGELVLRDEELLPWPRPPAAVREQLGEYYGLIRHLDAQIGRILDALARSPHASNTYIVYAADHGLALGSHGLLGKQNVYEPSMRCPLIIAGPSIPSGKSTTAFTYLYDLFPTFCRLTQTPVQPDLDGFDLSPLWNGSATTLRDSVFLPYQGSMRALRDERWKLICYPQVNHRQLFDLHTDPDERVNVAGDPAHRATIDRLLTQMQAWQKQVGDTQTLTVSNPKPLIRDLTGLKRKPDPWQPQWVVEKYFNQLTP